MKIDTLIYLGIGAWFIYNLSWVNLGLLLVLAYVCNKDY